jgi:hypothetical protein
MKGKKPLTSSQNNYERQVTEKFTVTGFFILSKSLIKRLGLLNATILASYLDSSTYWRNDKGASYDGWFFKTREHIMNELEVSLHSVRKGKKELTKLGILKTETKKHSQREWIQIQFACLYKLMDYDKGVVTPHPMEKCIEGCSRDLTPKDIISKLKIKKKNKKQKKEKKTKIILRRKTPSVIARQTSAKKDKDYMPLARRLLQIAKQRRKVHTTLPQLRGWSHHFRMLVEQNKVEWNRVEDSLDWYNIHWNDPFVPTILSAMTFREKFDKLEDAMRRHGVSTGTIKRKEIDQSRPVDIIAKRIGPNTKGQDIWMLQNVESALIHNSDLHDSTVCHNLINMYEWIKETRPKDIEERHLKKMLPPMQVLSEYIYWWGHQNWIKDKTESAFSAESGFFKKFLTQKGHEVGINLIYGHKK